MEIKEFVSKFRNHPVLFVGTGISLRYLKNSYTWDALLSKISNDIYGNKEEYKDIKASCADKSQPGQYDYPSIGSKISEDFDEIVKNDRNGIFKHINDRYYQNMDNDDNTSRFKLYLSEIFSTYQLNEEKSEELDKFRSIGKNIGSVITTNYDSFLEDLFSFKPLIGNKILLSQPYGSVYKIHGCVKAPYQIVITKEDYQKFEEKYDLIRAQLLSLFIHNPIIFLGYKINDKNIKDLLKTIFQFIEPNSAEANIIQDNFLLVEYDPGSNNTNINKYDVQLDGGAMARINILKTDNFGALYDEIANLVLSVSAMDIRKVQTIVRKIYESKDSDPEEKPIKVMISGSLDDLENGDYVLAIAPSESSESIEKIVYKDKTVTEYTNLTTKDFIARYFEFIDTKNKNAIEIINGLTIPSKEYFPILGFNYICPGISHFEKTKKNQLKNLNDHFERVKKQFRSRNFKRYSILEIFDDDTIAESFKQPALFYNIWLRNISIEDLRNYLVNYEGDRGNTDYRRLLCAYDLLIHSNENDKRLVTDQAAKKKGNN